MWGLPMPLYRGKRPMDWVASFVLVILELGGWMFLGFVGLILAFWLAIFALQAGIWAKNRLRGRLRARNVPQEPLDDQGRGNWRA